MDDVAGCRLIFESIEHLRAFRAKVHASRFRHRLRHDADKYDYIKKPKATGYRGIHDVYEYDVNSATNALFKGLYIEIQYRTLIQHAWATAVEVVGLITESQPKFEQGDRRYGEALALASELLSRAHEGMKGPLPLLEDSEVVEQFDKIDAELSLMQTLTALNLVKDVVTLQRNIILILPEQGGLEIVSCKNAKEAVAKLFVLEKERPESDIVLVRAGSSDAIRLAFRNYFSDAQDFIRLVEEARSALTGTEKRVL